jgi:hypothetical protein
VKFWDDADDWSCIMPADFHHVPGRLRVRVPRIKGAMTEARALESSLSAIKGVSGVESRELTGSIIIHYDPQTVDLQTLLLRLGNTAIPIADSANGARALGSKLSQKIARKTANAIFWHLLEMAMERTIPLLAAALL